MREVSKWRGGKEGSGHGTTPVTINKKGPPKGKGGEEITQKNKSPGYPLYPTEQKAREFGETKRWN